MHTLTPERLDILQKRFAGKRIAVIGDLMLDRYFWGAVSRISPEAPVPVVEVESESARLGGAANVANNIASLGGIPILIGVIGNDSGAQIIRSLVEENKFPTHGLVVDAGRPTTVKTRVIAHQQHVVRIDREEKSELSAECRAKIMSVFEREAATLDGVILEDYNKGVLSRDVITSVIRTAGAFGKKVAVDPKFNNFFDYTGVSLFKPNRKESEEALGRRLATLAEMEDAARVLIDRLQAENVLMTLGEKGMLLLERNGSMVHIETKARHVADVSGAGDTVIATLSMAVAAGANIREAAMLANYAGGIVCGEVGIVPIGREVLIRETLADLDHRDGQ